MNATRSEDADLGALVRRYRVHSETSREVVREGERRRTAALEVRLWATMARGAGGLPGEPGCREAVRALAWVAEAALARDGGAPAGEVEPFRLAVYESRQHPGCDEVYLAIRLPLRFGEDGAEDEAREARLKALRSRLERLGVYEGRWREPPRPAAEEAWAVRPAALAFTAPGAPPPAPGPAGAAEPRRAA